MLRSAESRVVRGWAVLDLVITALLAVPPLASVFMNILYAVNGHLGGVSARPPFEPVHWLFVCLMGGLGVTWAVARILLPMRLLGRIDGIARLWVCALIAYFVFVRGAPPVLLVFLVTELAGALHQLWSLRSSAREARW